jgi:hypothetical protein
MAAWSFVVSSFPERAYCATRVRASLDDIPRLAEPNSFVTRRLPRDKGRP